MAETTFTEKLEWLAPVNAKFQAGDQVQIQAWANCRTTPGYIRKQAIDLVTVLAPGTIVTIANGSADADNLTWWFIKTGECVFGWVAEQTPGGVVLFAPYDDSAWGQSIAFVLRWEGGYVYDPHDPGGETNYGISKNAYPNRDIKNLSLESARQIYFSDYWQASGADKLPWPLCLMHFDFAVNAGVGQANRTLAGAEFNFERYAELRKAFYRSLNTFQYYGAAWLRRIDDLVKVAVAA